MKGETHGRVYSGECVITLDKQALARLNERVREMHLAELARLAERARDKELEAALLAPDEIEGPW